MLAMRTDMKEGNPGVGDYFEVENEASQWLYEVRHLILLNRGSGSRESVGQISRF